MSVWEVFRERGFFQQATDMEALDARSREGQLTGYIGFDPTADSFHVGHLIPLMSLLHFQREGHRPIALLGGGTAMIGDPTGKNEMRKMLSVEELDSNIAALRVQLGRLLDFDQGALLVNNADWLRELNYVDFLREIGPHFSVNRMLTFETFKTRMEGAGLSFIEFNYPLLQSYDFLELHKRHGCSLQMGGDDQWANIISGVDLVRRKARAAVFGLTFPLLTLASGAKMGKTEQGAVWLDREKTPPYDYYQYWVNVGDADVEKLLALFTLLPMDEVRRLGKLEGAELREAKAVLVFEATTLIHGKSEAEKAQAGARALFPGGGAGAGGGGGNMGDVPTTALAPGRLAAGLLLTDILTEVGLAKSKGEVRRLIQQGGVSVNNERVPNHDYALTDAHAGEEGILLRVGKKKYHRLTVGGEL